MKKRLIVIFSILLLLSALGIGGYVYLKESTKTVIHTGLSDRSKEFIASQKKGPDTSWDSVSLEKKRAGESDFDSQLVTVKNCYTIVVPFQITDDRQNDPCVYYAILQSPRGSMTTNLRTVGFQSVEDAPDVSFRRGKKDQYTETSFQVKGAKYLVFTDMTTGTEMTAFGMQSGKLFTVSLSIGSTQDVQLRQIKKIVESFALESSN